MSSTVRMQAFTAAALIGAAVMGLLLSYAPATGGEEQCSIIAMVDWWWDRQFPIPNEYAHSGGENPEHDSIYSDGDWDEHTENPYRIVYENDYHWPVDPGKTYNAHQACGGPGGSN